MQRNKSPGGSFPSGSTAASIESEYDSVRYILIVRKWLVFKSFGSIYLPVVVLFVLFSNFQEGVLIFATQHFITLIRKSYFAE